MKKEGLGFRVYKVPSRGRFGVSGFQDLGCRAHRE